MSSALLVATSIIVKLRRFRILANVNFKVSVISDLRLGIFSLVLHFWTFPLATTNTVNCFMKFEKGTKEKSWNSIHSHREHKKPISAFIERPILRAINFYCLQQKVDIDWKEVFKLIWRKNEISLLHLFHLFVSTEGKENQNVRWEKSLQTSINHLFFHKNKDSITRFRTTLISSRTRNKTKPTADVGCQLAFHRDFETFLLHFVRFFRLSFST